MSSVISLLHLGKIDYATALDLQHSLVELRKLKKIGDVLLLLEHPPIITLGRNSQNSNLLAPKALLQQKGVEVCECDRGGDVTFHGPGQLVGYPIFDLRATSPRIGAVDFVRKIEEVLIRTCGDMGIHTERIPGLTGVWTEGTPRKIAAIGIHISRAVTSHGFALNVTTDLDYFKLIVPCGISDKPVTSIGQEMQALGRPVPSFEQVSNAVSTNFGRVFGRQMLWLESLTGLLRTGLSEMEDIEAAEAAAPDDTPLQVPKELREMHGDEELFLA